MNRLALLCSLVLLGCDAERVVLDVSPTADAEEASANPVLDGVTWGLDWDLGGAEYTEAGWAITNDLGFTFVLEDGWLIDYSLTLVPCADSVADAGWERFLGIGLAHAHHSIFDDPSQVEPQHPEELAAPGFDSLESVSFSPATYCSVHWLVAKADDGAIAPDGSDLSNVALSVSTRWEGAESSGVLELSTEWTNGVLLDLTVPESELTEEPTHASVTVVRSLAGLFDGIDPTVSTELEAAWVLLTNLVDQAEVRFEVDVKR
jgi:hypothetical protein